MGYVITSSNILELSFICLVNVKINCIDEEKLSSVPLLVMANKQDLLNALSPGMWKNKRLFENKNSKSCLC